MDRRIVIFIVALALVALVQSDKPLRCYSCHSLNNESCGSEMTKIVDCMSTNSMKDHQQEIDQHGELKDFKWIFDVDRQVHNPQNMACAKIIVNVEDKKSNPRTKKEVIFRSCQVAKAENIDPCKTILDEAKNRGQDVVNCSLCTTDTCNSTTNISPNILYILLSFLGSLVHITFYRLA